MTTWADDWTESKAVSFCQNVTMRVSDICNSIISGVSDEDLANCVHNIKVRQQCFYPGKIILLYITCVLHVYLIN